MSEAATSKHALMKAGFAPANAGSLQKAGTV